MPRLIWVFVGAQPLCWFCREAVHMFIERYCTVMIPVWSESSLSAWRKLGSLATHWAHSEHSDQTGWMARLIWVFAGHTVILLVLSWSGSYNILSTQWHFIIGEGKLHLIRIFYSVIHIWINRPLRRNIFYRVLKSLCKYANISLPILGQP